MRKPFIAAVAAGIAVAACTSDAPTATEHAHDHIAAGAPSFAAADNQTLASIRAATAKYHRVAAALADGYAPTSPCVAAGPLGAMGFHYSSFGLVDGTVDASAPETLLYAPHANGELRLVGVEYVVVAPAWDATHSTPPTLAGATFADHRNPAAWHGLPFPHYDLHVWVWRHNPAGMFADFNPDLSCAV